MLPDSLPPELAPQAGQLRILPWVFGFLVLLFLGVLGVGGWLAVTRSVPGGVVVGVTGLGGAWAMAWLGRHLVRTQAGRLESAALLLRLATPRPMAMRVSKVGGWNGMLITLHDVEEPARPPVGAALRLGRYQKAGEGQRVEVYRAPNPAGVLAVRWRGELHLARELDLAGMVADQRRVERLLLLTAGLLLVMILTLIGVLSRQGFQMDEEVARAVSSHGWPTTGGSVIRSEVMQRTVRPAKAAPYEVWEAQVGYRYTVGERLLEGGRVRLDDFPEREPGPARAVVERYPVGTAVTVHYDPADPALAVLEPGGEERLGKRASRHWRMVQVMPMMAVVTLPVFWVLARVLRRRFQEFTDAYRAQGGR